MALCRCKEKHSNPKGRAKDYVLSVEPLGYPENTSSICGIKDDKVNCTNPGLIWLTEDEKNEYNNGVRIFAYATNVCKVKVK